MGMYTELVLKCQIKEDVPQDVRAVLNFLFNGGDWENPPATPDHPFFACARWVVIGRGCSFYHTPFALSKFSDGFDDVGDRGGYIFSRSDLKDYEDEIRTFIDWLTPYIDQPDGDCIGWEWYEEDERPTLLIKGEKGDAA